MEQIYSKIVLLVISAIIIWQQLLKSKAILFRLCYSVSRSQSQYLFSESKLRKIGQVETENTRNLRTKSVLIKVLSKTNFGVFFFLNLPSDILSL